MRKYFPIIISFLLLLVSIVFWDKIRLPYNESNLIIGEYYFKKFNPQNDSLRFILFIIPSVLVYLISYLKINKLTYKFDKNHEDYFLNNTKEKNEKNSLNNYFFFFIILITIEFCTIDFQSFLTIDTFHDSVFLTPPLNYLSNKVFFRSTLYDYGFVGNNLGLVFNYFFGFYTLGAINFVKLVLIFLVKFSLILISKKLTNYLNYDIFFKKLFFILFTFILLSLPSYYDFTSYFSPRSALYLFFIFLLGSALCDQRFKELKFFIIGSFSLLSLLWWFDIGFYTNFLLIILGIYLFVHSEKKNFFFLLLGFFSVWLLFLLITPTDEIKAFFYNLKFIIFTTDYLIGIEYLKPFSNNSGRWTKALFIIYISCIVLINFNFSKKINLNYNLKIFLNLIFISGILVFKSALTRSDAYHLKYSSGLYTLVFIFIILYFIFSYLEKNKSFTGFFNQSKNELQINFIFISFMILSVFFFSGIINKKNNIVFTQKFYNIINIKTNIAALIKTDDIDLLKEKDLSAFKKYKDLSNNDRCLQYFSDDNFFPFFLKKPSCTKFYLSNQIVNSFSEEEFISEFKKSMPNIILYESPTKLLLNYDNLPNAMIFVRNNYEFYENFNGYIFYKKIEN